MDRENDESYEEGYQDALEEIGRAIRFLRQMHSTAQQKKQRKAKPQTKPDKRRYVDERTWDLSEDELSISVRGPVTPEPSAPQEANPRDPTPPTAAPRNANSRNTITLAPIPRKAISRAPALRAPTPREAKKRKVTPLASIPRNTISRARVLRDPTPHQPKKRKTAPAQVQPSGPRRQLRGSAEATSRRGNVGEVWRRAMMETGMGEAVTKGMYINGEVKAGGEKAVTRLRETPCFKCAKRNKVCLVPDPVKEKRIHGERCGWCIRLGGVKCSTLE